MREPKVGDMVLLNGHYSEYASSDLLYKIINIEPRHNWNYLVRWIHAPPKSGFGVLMKRSDLILLDDLTELERLYYNVS